MTVTEMARSMSGNSLQSWYMRHPEEIGLKNGDLPPAGFTPPGVDPDDDITGHDPNDWQMVDVPDSAAKELKSLAFQHINENYGMSGKSGFGANDIIRAYSQKVSGKQARYNTTRTLTQIFHDEAVRLQDFVRSRIPGWQTGQPFDTSILDDYVSGIDIKA